MKIDMPLNKETKSSPSESKYDDFSSQKSYRKRYSEVSAQWLMNSIFTVLN